MRFIHQLKGWPCLRWDAAEIEDELSAASFELGKFSGRLNAIGYIDGYMKRVEKLPDREI